MSIDSPGPQRTRATAPDTRVVLALALLTGAFLFVGLGSYGVVNGDEGLYHGVAERMVQTGDLFQLDFRGERRVYDTFMNSPLHYWARAALIATLGSTLFTMRALSALFGVATVIVTYLLGCRLAGRRAAILAALVQLTTFQFVYLHGARTGELDTMASCLLATCCLTFLRGAEDGRSFLPHHLALVALGMTKLPLVIVPFAAELVWLALHPSARGEMRRYAAWGLALLPVALLWHGTQAWLERDQVGEVLSTMAAQASGQGTSTGPPARGPRLGPLGNLRFYANAILYGSLPWAAAYPFAILATLCRGASAPGRRTALVFAATVLGFFVFVTKHFPWYVMPAYPFLSILVGAWLVDVTSRQAPAWSAWGAGAVIATCAWVGVDPFGTNPFATPAWVFPMRVEPRGWLGLSPVAAIALVGGVFASVWIAARGRIPGPLRRGLGAGLTAVLFVVAVLRVLAPLQHLGHQSPLVRMRATIDRGLEEGRTLDYPIELGRAPILIVRFLFADDFEILKDPVAEGARVTLHRKGDPRVLSRSLGRAGYQWRANR